MSLPSGNSSTIVNELLNIVFAKAAPWGVTSTLAFLNRAIWLEKDVLDKITF